MLPVKHGSPTVPMPGYDVQIVDEAAHPVPDGKMGAIVMNLPLPPGALPTLWQQDERMRESYLAEFPGYYKTADAGYKDADGYLYIMSRTDDIINVAGHRLSTGAMEEVLSAHPDIAECAVVGVADEIDAAVIVLGSRGLTGVRELARGSVSHDVAGHAERPVLIVPPARHGELAS